MVFSAFGALTLAGCGASGDGPDARETTAYDGIASGEAICLAYMGPEPLISLYFLYAPAEPYDPTNVRFGSKADLFHTCSIGPLSGVKRT